MPLDSTTSLRERISDVAGHLDDGVFPLVVPYAPAEVGRWRARLGELQRESDERRLTPVAMVGSTGAGKSTLLNALLGREILPVSSMKPCTAVVTTVRHSDEDSYRATVGFLTRDEWEQELRVSGDLLIVEVGEEEQAELATWEDLKRVTRDKLKAVYGLVDVDAHSRLDVASLPLAGEIAALLDSDSGPVTITESDPKEFARKLKRYLAGDERYWPLVKSVSVDGPFPALASGAVLIDLPGVYDPNAAREEVTRRFLAVAELVWVVFNTKRGVTADVRNLLLEQKLLRHGQVRQQAARIAANVAGDGNQAASANAEAEIDRVEGMLAEIAHLRERGASAA